MKSQVENTHRVDEAQALEYANLYFSQTQTRSTADLKRDYIVEDIVTRSGQAAKDTLAYVFNRGEEEGFVLIATDNRVYPLLAFSDTGYFEYEKGSPVDFAFVSRLGAYYEAHEGEEAQTMELSDAEEFEMYEPYLSTSWSQRSPWNKYVAEEHPNCLAGCFAVATGMIMAHCKDSLNYHGINFDFYKINEALRTQGEPDSISSDIYDYDTAMDYAAKLLYWIGKDVNMVYTPEASAADIELAGPFLKGLKYRVGSWQEKMYDYDLLRVIYYIKNNCLVLMSGSREGAPTGHAWVVDGCYTSKLWYSPNYHKAAIHCDWGWGGNSNGYFNGNVFKLTDRNYEPTKYQPVHNEKFKQTILL